MRYLCFRLSCSQINNSTHRFPPHWRFVYNLLPVIYTYKTNFQQIQYFKITIIAILQVIPELLKEYTCLAQKKNHTHRNSTQNEKLKPIFNMRIKKRFCLSSWYGMPWYLSGFRIFCTNSMSPLKNHEAPKFLYSEENNIDRYIENRDCNLLLNC